MVSWPEPLVREIAERRVVLFAGSGLSKAAHAAFPTWAELLDFLCLKLPKKKDRDLVSSYIKQGRMLDAAQIVVDGISRADLNASLKAKFQIRPLPFDDLYNHILLLDPKIVVTTNYDEFIEENFKHYNGSETHSISNHSSKKLLTDIRSPTRSILKIHGCITDPSDVVLERASYFSAKGKNPAIFAILSSLMTINTVLFLGYSVSDPDIQMTLENVNLNTPSDHPHYALVSKFDHPSVKNSLEKTYNIQFIEYPKGQHGTVKDSIKSLMESVIKFRQERGIV